MLISFAWITNKQYPVVYENRYPLFFSIIQDTFVFAAAFAATDVN